MIILSLKKSNTNFKKSLEIYKNMVNLPYMECPYCGSSDLIKWGSYERGLIYIVNGILNFITIRIKRVRCKHCGHTHAIIPSIIIPYIIHALDTILFAISDGEITLSLRYDTIEKWKKIFNKFLPYLKTMFNNITKSEIISKLKQNIFEYYEQFYYMNKKILMMTHYGVLNMAHF